MKTTIITLLMACGVLAAQTPAQEGTENANRGAAGLAPIYRVTVTERTTKAISYQHRSGQTKIDFGGTALMPDAHGEAKVEGKKGYISIEAEFRNLPEATKFGEEYLTYVLWAITPEGRTSNLGEILRSGTSGKLNVTTELQVFGLLVTAEPYFAVSRPSDVVVMENEVRPDTAGKSSSSTPNSNCSSEVNMSILPTCWICASTAKCPWNSMKPAMLCKLPAPAGRTATPPRLSRRLKPS